MYKILFFLVLLCVGFFSNAQFKIGVTTGMSHNMPNYSVSSDSLANQTAKGQGFQIGGFFDYEFDALNFMGELLFSVRNYHTEMVNIREESDITLEVEKYGRVTPMYLDMPLTARFNLSFQKGKYGDVNKLSFLVGPVLSLQLSESYYRETTRTTTVYDQVTTVKEEFDQSGIQYRSLDIGGVAGVMFEWEFGLRVGARYQFGILTTNTNEAYDIKFNSAQFCVGYTLYKKR